MICIPNSLILPKELCDEVCHDVLIDLVVSNVCLVFVFLGYVITIVSVGSVTVTSRDRKYHSSLLCISFVIPYV